MQTLDRVQNKLGTFPGIDVAPPAGTSWVTVRADMPPSEVADATNWLRIDVEADFGLGFRLVKRGADFHGGPAQVAPATRYQFDPTRPPVALRGVLVNGLRGNGPPASPAVCGLITEFSSS